MALKIICNQKKGIKEFTNSMLKKYGVEYPQQNYEIHIINN